MTTVLSSHDAQRARQLLEWSRSGGGGGGGGDGDGQLYTPNKSFIPHAEENQISLFVDYLAWRFGGQYDDSGLLVPLACSATTYTRPNTNTLVTTGVRYKFGGRNTVLVGVETFLPRHFHQYYCLPPWLSLLARCSFQWNGRQPELRGSLAHFIADDNDNSNPNYKTSVEMGVGYAYSRFQPYLRLFRRLTAILCVDMMVSLTQNVHGEWSPSWSVGASYNRGRDAIETNVHAQNGGVPSSTHHHPLERDFSIRLHTLPIELLLIHTSWPIARQCSAYVDVACLPVARTPLSGEWGFMWRPRPSHGIGVGVQIDARLNVNIVVQYVWGGCRLAIPIRVATLLRAPRDNENENDDHHHHHHHHDYNDFTPWWWTLAFGVSMITLTSLLSSSWFVRRWWRRRRFSSSVAASKRAAMRKVAFDSIVTTAAQEQRAMLHHALVTRRVQQADGGLVIVCARYGVGLATNQPQNSDVDETTTIKWPCERQDGGGGEVVLNTDGEDVVAYIDVSVCIQFWVSSDGTLSLVGRSKKNFLGFYDVLLCPQVRQALHRRAHRHSPPVLLLEIVYQYGNDTSTRQTRYFYDLDPVELS